MIGGHSKFLLVTGECCKKRWHVFSRKLLFGILCVGLVFLLAKKHDKCCPAMHSFETRTCSAEFWAPAFYWCCRITFVFLNRHSSLFTSGFCWFCVPCGFPVKASDKVFSYLDLRHQTWRPLLQTMFFWDCFNAWSGILVARHGLFCHMCCANRLNLFTTNPFCAENLEKTMKSGQV